MLKINTLNYFKTFVLLTLTIVGCDFFERDKGTLSAESGHFATLAEEQ